MNASSIFILFVIVLIDSTECVNVTIYYEALCPDSTSFIALQLYPNYAQLKNNIQLEFVPYGKAIHNFVNRKWQFECQHGKDECKGNKFQSCALAQNNGEDKDVSFINCVMRERNPADINKMKNCADKVNINWNKIKRCAQTDEGDVLLARNGNKTNNLNPNLSFVPTIVYDDLFDEYLQEQSLVDFAAVVCSKIKSDKPQICDNKKLPEKKSYWNYFR